MRGSVADSCGAWEGRAVHFRQKWGARTPEISRVPRARGVWCPGRFRGPPDVPPPAGLGRGSGFVVEPEGCDQPGRTPISWDRVPASFIIIIFS